MATTHKWVAVISKLNELTHEKRLDWERMDPPNALVSGVNDRIFNFFGASYEGRKIGIWEERFQMYNSDLDNYYWQQREMLAVFSDAWDLQVHAPIVAGISQLFETVRNSEANLDEFFDDILKDPDEDEAPPRK
jgi:hypothetical protein